MQIYWQHRPLLQLVLMGSASNHNQVGGLVHVCHREGVDLFDKWVMLIV